MALPSKLSPPQKSCPIEDAASARVAQPLHDHALEQLSYIRTTLESSATFTAVSGSGVLAMGVVAIIAGTLTPLIASGAYLLPIWLAAGVLGYWVGGWSLLGKAKRDGIKFSRGIGRRFLLSLTPPLAAGAVLSLALFQHGATDLIAATWLLLYGVGVTTAGAFSVRALPSMGLCFMGLGLIAFLLPPMWSNTMLLLGFGGLHTVFGAIIVRYYGG